MKLTVKKNVFQCIVESIRFVDVVNFFCCKDKESVLVQAYEGNAMHEIFADIVLSPESLGGVLNHYSLTEDYLSVGFDMSFLLYELEDAEEYVKEAEDYDESESYITIETVLSTGEANFRFHSLIGGEPGDDQYNFTLSMLPAGPDYALNKAYKYNCLQLSAKPSATNLLEFSNQCKDLVLKGFYNVNFEISDSTCFKIYADFKRDDDSLKKPLVRMEVDIPSFSKLVFHSFMVRYLHHFTKAASVISDVTINCGIDTSDLLFTYKLTKTDYIKLFLGPSPDEYRRYYGVEDLEEFPVVKGELGSSKIVNPISEPNIYDSDLGNPESGNESG